MVSTVQQLSVGLFLKGQTRGQSLLGESCGLTRRGEVAGSIFMGGSRRWVCWDEKRRSSLLGGSRRWACWDEKRWSGLLGETCGLARRGGILEFSSCWARPMGFAGGRDGEARRL